MKKRLVPVLSFVLLAVVAGAVFAQKSKTATVVIKRVEGKQQPDMVFNPAEISIDKSVPWSRAADSTDDAPSLEFTAGEPKSMSFELMFDTFESRENVYQKFVASLDTLTVADPQLKRPPMLTFTWGGLPAFSGVVESISTKYTMFLPDGQPCRATVQLKMKQASKLSSKKEASN